MLDVALRSANALHRIVSISMPSPAGLMRDVSWELVSGVFPAFGDGGRLDEVRVRVRAHTHTYTRHLGGKVRTDWSWPKGQINGGLFLAPVSSSCPVLTAVVA